MPHQTIFTLWPLFCTPQPSAENQSPFPTVTGKGLWPPTQPTTRSCSPATSVSLEGKPSHALRVDTGRLILFVPVDLCSFVDFFIEPGSLTVTLCKIRLFSKFYCLNIAEITCADPGGVENGFRSPRAENYSCGAILTYFCHPQFELRGEQTIQCEESGKFNASAPKCKGIQHQNFSIPFNRQRHDFWSNVIFR